MTVFGQVKGRFTLTWFYPHDGHQVKKDFRELLTQATTEKNIKQQFKSKGSRKIQLVCLGLLVHLSLDQRAPSRNNP